MGAQIVDLKSVRKTVMIRMELEQITSVENLRSVTHLKLMNDE